LQKVEKSSSDPLLSRHKNGYLMHAPFNSEGIALSHESLVMSNTLSACYFLK
jgi:hypothetical protein